MSRVYPVSNLLESRGSLIESVANDYVGSNDDRKWVAHQIVNLHLSHFEEISPLFS